MSLVNPICPCTACSTIKVYVYYSGDKHVCHRCGRERRCAVLAVSSPRVKLGTQFNMCSTCCRDAAKAALRVALRHRR